MWKCVILVRLQRLRQKQKDKALGLCPSISARMKTRMQNVSCVVNCIVQADLENNGFVVSSAKTGVMRRHTPVENQAEDLFVTFVVDLLNIILSAISLNYKPNDFIG